MATTSTGNRSKKRIAPSHKSFKLQKRIKSPAPKVDSGFLIAKEAWQLIWSYRATFLVQLLAITFLYALLVRGFGQIVGLQDIQDSLESGIFGQDSNLAQSFNLLGTLFSSSVSSQGEAASIYQVLIFIITSLSTIWLLRGAEAKEEDLSVKESYFAGTSQFVAYIMVLLYIGVLLIPLVFANGALAIANTGGLLVDAPVRAFALVLVALINLFSLYLVASAIMALFVVSLPNGRPIAAIKTSNKIVEHRRLIILARFVALIVVFSIIVIAIMIPIISFAAGIAEYVFFFLSTLMIIYIHAYMYKLYKALIQ